MKKKERNQAILSNLLNSLVSKFNILLDKSKLKPFMRPEIKLIKENKTEIHFFGY